MNTKSKRLLKIILWIITGIIVLIIALVLSLNLPGVQNYLKDKVITYLKERTNTTISLKRLRVRFPDNLELNQFFIADQKHDTLLYAERLYADLDMWALLKNKIRVKNIELNTVRANVHRNHPDTVFNYQFLADSLISNQAQAATPEKDTTAPLQLDLKNITFTNIRLSYKDDVAGNTADLNMGRLSAVVSKCDLEQMRYALDTLTLQHTQVLYHQQKPLTVLQQVINKTIDSTAGQHNNRLPLITSKAITLDNVNLNYDDRLSDTKAAAQLNTFHINGLIMDLTNGSYTVADGLIANNNITVAYRPTPTNEKALQTSTDSVKSSPFSLQIGNIILDNNNITYDNLAAPQLKEVLDYNHLNIKGLGLSATNILLDSTHIKGNIVSGQLKDGSGFVLNQLQGAIVYDNDSLSIANFRLRTPKTFIENNSLLEYSSKDDLTKHPEKVKMYVNLRHSLVDLGDIHYLSHSVPRDYRNQKISAVAILNGYLGDLSINTFQLQGLKNTLVNATGHIRGLPDMNKTVFNIHLNQLATSRQDMLALIPKSSLPTGIELPGHISASGSFTGTMEQFATRLNVRTDMGAAMVNGSMNMAKNRQSYQAKISLDRFNLGKLLRQQDLGTVSITAKASGQGFDAKKATANIAGTIHNAYYNKYTYRNVDFNGSYKHNTATLDVDSKDSNALLVLHSAIALGKKTPSLKGTINMKNVDLKKLNFYTADAIQLAGLVHIDMPEMDMDHLNGKADISGLQLVKNGEPFKADSILLEAYSSATENRITLQSEVLNASITGKYQLTQLGQAFTNILNRYYAISPTKKIPPQIADFDISIRNSTLLNKLVPSLSSFSGAGIKGSLNTVTDSLFLTASFPAFVYDSISVKNLAVDINNRDSARLNYALHVQKIVSPSIQLFNSGVQGAAQNNQLDVHVFLKDSKDKEKYTIGGIFNVDKGTYQFRLDPEKLLLNYDKWKVAPDNLVQYGNAGVTVRHFDISNNGQSLSVNSVPAVANAPLRIQFTNFLLETLTRYSEQDTSLVGGTLNGTAAIKDIQTNPKFESALTVTNLRYKTEALGDASINVNNNTANAYETHIALKRIHDLTIDGFYYTQPGSTLDMKVAVNKIDLKHIEGLSEGQLKNGSGTVTGNLTINGPVDAPKILGALTFKDAALTIAKFNADYGLQNETVTFQPNGISFKDFTLLDSAKQKLTVNGMIFTKDYRDYAFNLKLRGRNFRVMNASPLDNDLFYGKLYVNVNADIKGDLNQPKVNMNLTVNPDTRFTLVLPDQEPGIADQAGIVAFVDADAPADSKAPVTDSLTLATIKGMDISGNITIDKDAELTIIVDPKNGDALRVKGQADLALQMDPSGKTSLTGRYELSEGGYNLSIGGLAKREFKIKQGSSIVWTGEPTAATVNITAVYNVNTSPIDLVAAQIQDLDQTAQNKYKQKTPFMVYLKLKGELLKPDISFELDMPENERNAFDGTVYTRLQQINTNESELNKQVFALLALNRFISDNPFQSLSGGVTAESIARQSVSRLLTQQLNNFASSLIKGVDINFDLNSKEDYSTGNMVNRTDLNVAFSKKLLNDRLTVTVGSSFALEGAQQTNQRTSTIAGNINVEYQLSRDGRYRLRFYRRNQTEGVIEGEIIETGLGFAVVVDYNKFKEVFDSFKKRKQGNGNRNR